MTPRVHAGRKQAVRLGGSGVCRPEEDGTRSLTHQELYQSGEGVLMEGWPHLLTAGFKIQSR